jgi:hypothetical protein
MQYKAVMKRRQKIKAGRFYELLPQKQNKGDNEIAKALRQQALEKAAKRIQNDLKRIPK